MRVLKYCKGITFHIVILLSFTFKATFASALVVNQPFPDFTLPSAYTNYAQQLSEQQGKPVMLIVLDRCNRCEKKLLRFQHLNSIYALDDLVTWVVWTEYKKDQPPHISLSVLEDTANIKPSWQIPNKRHALYLINRDGVLEHALYGSLKKLQKQAEPLLAQWMQQGQARPEGQ